MKITVLFLLIGCLDHAVCTESNEKSGAPNATTPLAGIFTNTGSGASMASSAGAGIAGSEAAKTSVSTSLNNSFSKTPITSAFTTGSGYQSIRPNRDTEPPGTQQPVVQEHSHIHRVPAADEAGVNEDDLKQKAEAVESGNVVARLGSDKNEVAELPTHTGTFPHTITDPENEVEELPTHTGTFPHTITNPENEVEELPTHTGTFPHTITDPENEVEEVPTHTGTFPHTITDPENGVAELPTHTGSSPHTITDPENEVGEFPIHTGSSPHTITELEREVAEDLLTDTGNVPPIITDPEIEIGEVFHPHTGNLPHTITEPENEIAEQSHTHTESLPHVLTDLENEIAEEFLPRAVSPTPPLTDSEYTDALEEGAFEVFTALQLSCLEGHTCDDNVWRFIDNSLCSPCFREGGCICDENCHELENCCLDKVLWDTAWKWRPPKLSQGCHSSAFSARGDDFSDEADTVIDQHYFIMEDECPADWRGDQEVARKCAATTVTTAEGGGGRDVSNLQLTDDHHDDDGDYPLSRQRPAWSPVTNVTYRNVHCARCHGQDAAKLRRWDASVNCRDGTPLRNGVDILWDLVGEAKNERPDCYLEFSPPRGIEVEGCNPITFYTNTECETEPFADVMFTRTCETFFSNDSTTTTTTINNYSSGTHRPRLTIQGNAGKQNFSIHASYLFCSICWRASSFHNVKCLDPRRRHDTSFPFVLVVSFQALMSLRGNPARLGDSGSMGGGPCSCAFDEIYDTYESSCRKLHCSWGRSLNQQHNCVPSVEKTTGRAYHLAFQLAPTSADSSGLSVVIRHKDLLQDATRQILTAFKRQTGLTSVDRFDMFRVTARAKQTNPGENLRDGDLSSREGPSSAVMVESFDVQVKVITLQRVSFEELEYRLVNTVSSSVWNFSVDGYQGARSFRAIPLYTGTDRGDSRIKLEEDEREEEEEIDGRSGPVGEQPGRILPSSVIRVSSDGGYENYRVDIGDELLADFISDFAMVNYRPERYYPVQKTLMCSKVSFVLDISSPVAEDYDGDGETEILDAAFGPTVSGTGRRRKRNAVEEKADKKDERRIAQSVDKASGEVIVSLDLQTGWLHHHPSGRRVHFRYVDYLADGLVHVCAEQLFGSGFASDNPWEREKKARAPLVLEKHFSPLMIYVSLACQSLSTVCLFLAFFTYCVFPELRTLPGKNNMGLMASLFVAMLLFEVGVARVELPVVCTILGVAIHFSLLSGFTWMVLCSVHMHRVFTRLLASRQDHSDHDTRLFVKYVTMSLLVPAAIVTLTLVGNWATHREDCVLDLGYGRGICYLSNTWSLILASVLPICVAVVINLVLFVVTLRSLRSYEENIVRANMRHRKQLVVYVRMSTLTGINWLAGLLAAPIDSLFVWYLFIVLCGLQGVYIFVAFVCNNRVLALYRALLCCAPLKEKEVVTNESTRRVTPPCDDDAKASESGGVRY